MAKLAIIIPKEARAYLKQLKLTPSQKAVWYALQTFKDKTGLAWPTKETLAEESGVHVSNIRRITKQLAEFGLLTKEGKGGRNKPAHYQMLEPWAAGQAPQTGAKSTPVYAPNGGETTTRFEPLPEPQKGGQSASKTGGNLPPRIELSIEQSISRSGVVHQDFTKDSGGVHAPPRAEKFAPTQAAAEPTEPTPPSQPEPPPPPPPPPAQEPMPWDIEDEDDVPPWEREQPQQPANLRSKPEELQAKPEELQAKPEEREQLTLLPAPAVESGKAKKQKPTAAKRAQQNGGWVEAKKPDDISQEMWDTWCRQRTKHKWYLTDIAVDEVRRRAQKVNILLQDAVQMMIVNDWRGFNDNWDSVKAALNIRDNEQRFKSARERDIERARREHKEMYGEWWGEWEKNAGDAMRLGHEPQQVFDVRATVVEQ